MKLSAVIEARLGIENLAGKDPTAVFDEVAAALVAAGASPNGSQASLRQAFVERERQGTTALGYGVAIPHIFHPSLEGIHVVVAKSRSGIPFGSPDGQSTTTLICIAGPESQRDTYLKFLSAIAKTLRDRNWRKFILQAPNTAGVFEILLEACPD